MKAETLPVKKRERAIILHAVGLWAGFVLRPKITPSFLSPFPVVHANIHRLPIKILAASCAAGRSHNLEKDSVNPRSAGNFPRTSDEFGVLGRYLRFSLRSSKEQAHRENAQETEQEHRYLLVPN